MRFLGLILLIIQVGMLKAEINGLANETDSLKNDGKWLASKKNTFIGDEDDFSIITPRRRPVGLTFILFGPTILSSLQIDYFVTEDVQLDLGFGFFGVFAGGKYHFIISKERPGTTVKDDYFQNMEELVKQNRAKKRSIYVGIDFVTDLVFEYDNYYLDVWLSRGVYVPVGIQWKGAKGFSYSAELAYLGLREVQDRPASSAQPYKKLNTLFFGLKMGYYF